MIMNLLFQWLVLSVLPFLVTDFDGAPLAAGGKARTRRSFFTKTNQRPDPADVYCFAVWLDEEDFRARILEDHPDFSEEQATDEVFASRAEANQIAVNVIRNRLASIDAAEPVIALDEGSGRILVQIPDVTKEQRSQIESIVRAPGRMQFFLVSKDSSEKKLRIFDKGLVPPGFRIAPFRDRYGQFCFLRDRDAGDVDYRRLRHFGQDEGITGDKEFFMLEKSTAPNSDTEVYLPIFVRNRAEMTVHNLFASVETDALNRCVISLSFDSKDAKEFARITRKHNALNHPPGRQLAIVFDDLVYSAPVLREEITGGSAQISGDFTFEEANFLKTILNAGAMPARVHFEERSFDEPAVKSPLAPESQETP